MYPMVTHAGSDCQAYLFDSLIMEEKSLSGVEPVYNQARDDRDRMGDSSRRPSNVNGYLVFDVSVGFNH